MNHEVETQWMGKMQFNALVNGHTMVMDAPERAGGEDHGPIPKPLLLTALSGCTGMDVVALLRKQGKMLTYFNVKVTGELTKQAPIAYSAIHILYELKGSEADQEAALEVVQRSQHEICGVSYMLKKALPVTWEVQFNNQTIFNNQAVAETA
ncbi:MAG: OsmC family protein [Chitinophagales bacterium]